MGIIVVFPRHGRTSAGSVKPKMAGSTLLPRARAAAENRKKYSAGIRPRAFQFEGACEDLTPAIEQAAALPPTNSTSSSMAETVSVTPREYSRSVSKSRGHGFGLGNSHGGGPSQAAMYSKAATAKRLIQTQEALEMTNAAISEKLGVASNAWSQYRTGERTIPHKVIVGLKEQFGVTSDWILAGDPSGLPQRLYARLRIAA